ncbi:MAG TPA: porin [Mucilaginibacter sp.]|jgi:phosphate-selective porin
MKLPYVIAAVLLLSILFTTTALKAQQNDDLINVLLKKNVINQKEADSIRADQAIKEQARKDKENQHGITIGSKALQISGLIQTEYQGFQQTGVNNAFSLHRARLDVKGDIDDNWNYEVYTEFAGTTKLLDAYSAYKIASFLKFTAGQFKVPFSIESLIADSQLEFIDRSQVANALVGRQGDVIGNQNGRDLGIQINGSFLKIDGRYLFDYTLGVFNGAGYDVTTDNNNHKDIVGRLSVHPINNLVVSANFYDGQGYYGTPAKNQLRNRGGVDARYVIGSLSLQAEYDKGTDGTIKRDGWYGQVGYFVIPKKLQLAAKYDTYDPNKKIATDRTEIYTAAATYYFNTWARFSINYLDRHEETPSQIKNNILEAQLQLTF